jgi:hypothetical protein
MRKERMDGEEEEEEEGEEGEVEDKEGKESVCACGRWGEGQSTCKVGYRSHVWGKGIRKQNTGKEVAASLNFLTGQSKAAIRVGLALLECGLSHWLIDQQRKAPITDFTFADPFASIPPVQSS